MLQNVKQHDLSLILRYYIFIMKLKITTLNENIKIPEYQTEGSSGMDLCAAITEPVQIAPLERALIPTGIKIEIPTEYEAQIRARSGLSIKHGITLINAIGTIDADYRGEIKIGLVNLSNQIYSIQPNDRIAQMVICRVEKADIEVVVELSETVRAAGGFGSTGR